MQLTIFSARTLASLLRWQLILFLALALRSACVELVMSGIRASMIMGKRKRGRKKRELALRFMTSNCMKHARYGKNKALCDQQKSNG